jgi:hypothetical protein
MKLHSRSIIATAAWLAFAGMAASACADGTPASHAAHHSTSPRSAPLTVAARKPNDSGVAIQYRVEGTAQAGRPVSVFLQFDGVTDPAGATVRLTTDTSLTLTSDKSLALPAGQRSTATATVTSGGDGLAYLNVFVTQNGAMSIVAIPIQTGSAAPAMKPAGEMKSSADGEKIISMPAQEPKAPVKKP